MDKMGEICKICGKESTLFISKKILKKFQIGYYKCNSCGFVQTEKPYWLNEAYESSFNLSDTGTAYRPMLCANIIQFVLPYITNIKGVFLDYAGGYGLFTRIARDMGFDFFTYDKYSTNLMARGFELKENEVFKKRFDLVTSFECFEHLENPLQDISKICSVTDNLFFSTLLVPKTKLEFENWWYLGLDHGQHISLYTVKSLQFIAKSQNKYYYNVFDSYHLFSSKKRSIILLNLLFIIGYFKYKTYIKSIGINGKKETDFKLLIN